MVYAAADVGGGRASEDIVDESTVIEEEINSVLGQELQALEGILGQNPETGANGGGSLLGGYSTRLFGCPFQLLDSVDRRFKNINTQVGNEFLRNFLLNSPILSIRPGMPRYTGDRDMTEAGSVLKNLYYDIEGDEGMGMVEAFMNELASSIIFGAGSKLQRRMFGFRDTYYDYCQHANYMCRSTAVFLSLTDNSGQFPSYTYLGNGDKLNFSDAKWENYRFMSDSHVSTPVEYLGELIGSAGSQLYAGVKSFLGFTVGNGIDTFSEFLQRQFPDMSVDGIATGTNEAIQNTANNVKELLGINTDQIDEAWENANTNTFADVLVNKISCVQFMVDPGDFSESLSNTSEPSVVEQAIDGITQTVGSELAWITNSRADVGLIGDLLGFMGDVTATALTTVGDLMNPVSGGFISNVFSGAIRSIRGQKMIYPEIYKSSKSSMDYEFTITLSSPYGDIYNYYMNILVPLLHLIALAAPRMVTSNTITSPYIVQAYIPGMCTCQLGIIENMVIHKNPTRKHVSVNGFPLTVTVTFKIKELYNALSISPANDPASFLYNETLNDYMANLAGLIPSVDTYSKQRKNAFANLGTYFKNAEYLNDIANNFTERVENIISPFT